MKLATISFLFLLISAFVSGQSQKHPYVATIQLRNCNKEMRVIPFVEPLTFFDRWIRGLSKLEKQKILKFSDDYIIDSNYLRDGIRKIRATLPNNFWDVREGEKWYDNEPNDEAIWFIKLFVQVDKTGENENLICLQNNL
jgi:hypothetical protein